MMIHRSLILRIAVWPLLLAFPLAQAVSAQEKHSQANPPQIGAQPSGSLAKDLQKRLSHMTKRYRLTAAQQTQVQSILLKEQQDRQTVSADRYMSGKDKHAEQASLFEASQQKIGNILTTQQKRKFQADEKRRAWMNGRLPNPNPGPALNEGW